MSEVIIDLLEAVVYKAWQEEKVFVKKFLNMKLKRNDSLCQGISRNVHRRIFGTFPNLQAVEFKVKEATHIVIYVIHSGQRYILDGSIKQFFPKEQRTVFRFKDYPFKKEVQRGKKWHY